MKAMKDQMYEFGQETLNVPIENEYGFLQHFDIFSSITTEFFYILDIRQKQFCYIKPHDFFLCGFSVEDALKDAYNFYSKIIYPEDLSLAEDMYKAVLNYIKDFEHEADQINYFSCTFRLQRNYSSHSSCLLPQMVYHRIKPIWEKNELRYLMCLIKHSSIQNVGNLRLYKINEQRYEEYNFITKRWKQKIKILITDREEAILTLAQQGRSSKQIAFALCKAQHTIRNQIKALFYKLQVHSIHEAIEIVFYHNITYYKHQQNKIEK